VRVFLPLTNAFATGRNFGKRLAAREDSSPAGAPPAKVRDDHTSNWLGSGLATIPSEPRPGISMLLLDGQIGIAELDAALGSETTEVRKLGRCFLELA